MAKNKINEGTALTLIAPSGGVVSGNGYKIGDIFGVATADAAQGAEFVLDTRGNYTLPKSASVTPAPCVKVYWDDTAKSVTTTVGSNLLIGIHSGKVAAGAADATLPVRLNGTA